MSFWSKLFGERGLPERTRGPTSERLGSTKNGKKHGLWIEREEYDWQLAEVIYKDGVREGPFRIWHRDTGALRMRGTMVNGEQHGTVEALHEGVVRYRFEKVAGKLHGPFRALRPDGSVEYEREYRDDKIWSGPYDIESTPGVFIQRASYVDGKRVGAYEDNDWNGRPKLRAHYVDGSLGGAYEQYDDGVLQLAGTYRDGMRVGAWRWHARDGSVIAESADGVAWRCGDYALPVPIADEDLPKWIELGRAWAQLGSPDGYWFNVEHAVDELPIEPAVAWLEAQIATRVPAPHRTTLGMGWIEHLVGSDDDPRAKLIDGIVVDHHGWDAVACARIVRRAHVMRVLGLYECAVEPDLAALFPDGVAWPLLEELSIQECGPLDAVIKRLAAAPWTSRLRELALDDLDGISGAAAAALVGSPHLGALRDLELHDVGEGFAPAFARSPLLGRLERLCIVYASELDTILDAIAMHATPALRELEIRAGDRLSKRARASIAKIEKSRPQLDVAIED